MAHPCPARYCGVDIPRGLIACQDHWHKLPTSMRQEWQVTSFDPKSMRHARAVLACIDWLQRRG